MAVWNRHRESKNMKLTKNTLRLLSSDTKLFITFELKVIRHKENDTQSFYADFSICITYGTRCKLLVWSRWALKVNRLLRMLKLNSLTFLKSPKSSTHTSGAWRHSHPPVTFSIWDFYFDVSEWRILPACAWTPALMLHLTNPCA